MNAPVRQIGTAGIAQPDIAMFRLLLQVLADRFEQPWQIIERADRDVVLANPRDSAGQRLIESARPGARIIAVVNRHDEPPPGVAASLRRPFRADDLVHALAAAEGGADSVHATATASDHERMQPLALALREASDRSAPDRVTVIDDLPGGPLVVDARRDLVLGAVSQLSGRRLLDATPCAVRTVAAEAGHRLVSGMDQAALRTRLWQLGTSIGAQRLLFGDADTTAVQMATWPRFPGSRLSRTQLRAASLIRRHARPVSEVAATAGIRHDELMPLLNATWLSGDLVAETRVPREPHVPTAARGTRGLLGRIRNRLTARSR